MADDDQPPDLHFTVPGELRYTIDLDRMLSEIILDLVRRVVSLLVMVCGRLRYASSADRASRW
jgi:hypothetical protein